MCRGQPLNIGLPACTDGLVVLEAEDMETDEHERSSAGTPAEVDEEDRLIAVHPNYDLNASVALAAK